MSTSHRRLKDLHRAKQSVWTHNAALYVLAFFGLILGTFSVATIRTMSVAGTFKGVSIGLLSLIAPIILLVQLPGGWTKALRRDYVNPEYTFEETAFADRYCAFEFYSGLGSLAGLVVLLGAGMGIYAGDAGVSAWPCLGVGLGIVVLFGVYSKATSVYKGIHADWDRHVRGEKADQAL